MWLSVSQLTKISIKSVLWFNYKHVLDRLTQWWYINHQSYICTFYLGTVFSVSGPKDKNRNLFGAKAALSVRLSLGCILGTKIAGLFKYSQVTYFSCRYSNKNKNTNLSYAKCVGLPFFSSQSFMYITLCRKSALTVFFVY